TDLGIGIPNPEKERFFISPYTKRKLKQIEMPDFGNSSSEVLLEWLKALEKVSGWEQLDAPELADLVEVQKIVFGWLIKLYPESRMRVSKDKISYFDKASAFIKNFGEDLVGEDLGKFLQALVLSEIKGAVAEFSRGEFIVRCTAQTIGSDEAYPLVLRVSEDQGEDWYQAYNTTQRPSLRNISHSWYLTGKSNLKTGKSIIPDALARRGKKDTNLSKAQVVDSNFLYKITTSKYQMQFLDALLKPSKAWGECSVNTSEPSLILEKSYKVNWDKNSLRPSLHAEGNSLFCSIPFEIVPSEQRSKQRKKLDNRSRYLGVDVGEYGLAWVVLEPGLKSTKLISKGFIYDEQLRRIRDHVSNMKSAQIKGTFGVPSTELARIRESAVGSIRNKVHDLALRYNAKPIYEYQISNFEVGSNRVVKVYKSVKVADVYADNDADNSFRQSIWGAKTAAIGNHVSAYATSQTCSKCRKSILEETDLNSSYKVVAESDLTLTVETNSSKASITKTKVSEGSGELKAKVVRKCAYMYSRPPLESLKISEFVKDLPAEDVKFWKRRGNSAIFICPFCNHISDADVQAAQNIAIRGYARDKKLESEQQVGVEDIGLDFTIC
ncbi:MAG: type V CRISPR-associated protein Cas12d/CasY, partial [Candidatus Dojkabacteria bacterium]